MGLTGIFNATSGTTCASEFDRSFILSAIDAWYGTRENFQNYVRGPLREQLLQLFPSPHLPCSYVALILCSMMAYSLDLCLSLYKAGASVKVVMKQLLCMFTLFGIWFWAAFNAIFYLSDRTAGKDAGPNHGSKISKCLSSLSECAKNFLVASAIFLWTLLGFVCMIACTRSTNLLFAGCWALLWEMRKIDHAIGYIQHIILIPSFKYSRYINIYTMILCI